MQIDQMFCRACDCMHEQGRCEHRMQIDIEKLDALYAGRKQEYDNDQWSCYKSDEHDYFIASNKDAVVGQDGVRRREDAELIVALRNAWPAIKKELEAGRKLAEAVKHIGDSIPDGVECEAVGFDWITDRNDALAAYKEATK